MPERTTDLATLLGLIVGGTTLLGSQIQDTWPPTTDASELTLCAVLGGVPHSPGYPLWTRLAGLVSSLPTGLHPIEAISWMGVFMACAAAVLIRSMLRAQGAGACAATAAAALFLTVPLCIRTFTIPEVHSLDLLLLTSAAWAVQRGTKGDSRNWAALGYALAVLAVGHRPVNIAFLLILTIGWRPGLLRSRAAQVGLVLGGVLQVMLTLDLWLRIQDQGTPWVDEQALPGLQGLLRFATGAPFTSFLIWEPLGSSIAQRPQVLGLQVLALVGAAFLVPWVWRSRREGWALLSLAGMNLCFIGVYRIQDAETLYLPVLWVGILAVGASVRLLPARLQGWAGLSMLVGVSCLAWLNYQAMGSSRSDDWQNRLMAVLSEAPEGSVIVSDDWPVRTGLVAIREIDGLGETLEVVRVTPDEHGAARVSGWLRGDTPLVQLEEHAELDGPRPIRIFDDRLLPYLEEAGLVVAPAEAGTWAVSLPDAVPSADTPASVE